MRHAATRDDTAGLDQLGDHGVVGFAFLSFAVKDLKACEKRHMGQEFRFLAHIVGHAVDPVARNKGFIVVGTVAGRGVDKARTRVIGHVIAVDHRNVVVPEAIGAVGTVERVLTDQPGQLICCYVAHAGVFGHAGLAQRVLGQRIGEDVELTRCGPAFFLGRVNAVETIGNLVVIRDGLVRRDRPRSGGPDHDTCLGQIPFRIRERERHPNRVRLVVVIFDLGLGQRGLFNRRPHHGLRALIQRAVHQELHEFLGDHAFGVEIHRQIGIVPLAGDAQTFELVPLDVDPALGELAAFLTEVDNVHVILVLALLAVLFLDLPFDGQTVAVPAGNIACIVAHHLVRAHDHVLDGLVQRVADMQVAVRIGGAIVQDEGLAVASCLAQAIINADLFPPGQPFGLALGQASAHREFGYGKGQRVFIFGCVGTHVSGPFQDKSSMSKKGRRVGPCALSRRLVWIRAPGI